MSACIHFIVYFINHFCDLNCEQFTASLNHTDDWIHELTFFALKNILVRTELRCNYINNEDNESVIYKEVQKWVNKVKIDTMRCLCRAEICKKMIVTLSCYWCDGFMWKLRAAKSNCVILITEQKVLKLCDENNSFWKMISDVSIKHKYSSQLLAELSWANWDTTIISNLRLNPLKTGFKSQTQYHFSMPQ